jgi:peptide/nickel transport system permease protein
MPFARGGGARLRPAYRQGAKTAASAGAWMLRMLLKRLALSLVTLWILSVIIFAGGQLLPGDTGRAIMGPFADERAVAALNHELGVDRPILVQYWEWISHFVVGDMGKSYAYRAPVQPFVATALGNSLKLAAVAFVLVVPLSLLGGVWAALRAGRLTDRLITLVGLSASTIPEFVSGIILILIFGVWLRWLPISATAPPGSGPLVQIYHLLLPAIPLILILFGYIARMARAGTIEALDADYTRTAVLKGLPQRDVLFRHVLRNSLLPTITVIGTQTGYLIGGLVVVEVLFRYQGIGTLIYTAARGKDFPLLESSILTIGVVYTIATLLADLLHLALNPRIRAGATE